MSKRIAVDKGHGGTNADGVYDPGAVGNGLRESDLVDVIGDGVISRLSLFQCTVLEVPRFDSLSARASWANVYGADLYLSIHCNAGGGTGFESYVHPNAGERTQEIQTTIHSAVMAFLERYDVVNRGRKTADYQVLRETAMPAVLLECLFVDHAEDAKLLADPAFRDRLANEIAYGIVRALDLKLKDPCRNCQRVNELIIERGNLFAEASRLRQIIRQAQCDLAAAGVV